MNKKLLLVFGLIGVGLFWSALVAEITLRFLPGNFIIMSSLVFLSCMCSGLLVYMFTRRVLTNVARDRKDGKGERSSEATRTSTGQPRRGPNQGGQNRSRRPQKSSDREENTKSADQSGKARSRPERRPRATSKSERTQGPKTARIRGQVKSYSQRQSYGFIRGDDGKQAFFHKTNLDPGLDDKNIEKDLAVTYEIREGDRGPVATKIQIAK